jgi:hypothetical protein
VLRDSGITFRKHQADISHRIQTYQAPSSHEQGVSYGTDSSFLLE